MHPSAFPDSNHPLATRMGVISFISQNLTTSCMWGSFGVLLLSVEHKLGVGLTLSSLPASIVTVAGSLIAPLVGAMAGRFSLRSMMLLGAVLAAAGYMLLALSNSIYIDYAAYGLLIGPGFCLTGSILPATLVTRWFRVGRGRALGLMNVPLLMVILPFAATGLLKEFGLATVYCILATLSAINIIPLLFVVDYPPHMPMVSQPEAGLALVSGVSTGELLSSLRFWVLTLAWSACISGAIVLASHLVPLARGWGIGATAAAGLLTLNALSGLAGAPVFGWLADRLGSRRAMTVLCINSSILWALLLSHPGLPVLMVVILLIGLHDAAGFAVVSMAFSESFGQAAFGRALGLATTACLPFTVLSVPIAAVIYVHTGSYALAILLQVGFFLSTGMLVFLTKGQHRAVRASPQALI